MMIKNVNKHNIYMNNHLPTGTPNIWSSLCFTRFSESQLLKKSQRCFDTSNFSAHFYRQGPPITLGTNTVSARILCANLFI